MKLELLLNREPFEEILISTLRRYFRASYGWEGSINWIERSCNSFTALRVNPRLNVLYPGSLEKAELRLMTMEFAFHPNIIRRFFQGLYVSTATSKFIENFTTEACVEINPWPTQLDQVCIIPGNHSIRLIDISNQYCDVIVKNDFDPQFIQTQIQVRTTFDFLPVPELLEYDFAEGWYRERRIVGLPWNRVQDRNSRRVVLQNAWGLMLRLYTETFEEITAHHWVELLIERIEKTLKKLPEIFTEEVFNRFSVLATQLKSIASDKSKLIKTSITHGDFQPANLMLSIDGSDQYWIIDWEYSERRFEVYDALVFISQCRFPGGLSERINSLLSSGLSRDDRELFSLQDLSDSTAIADSTIAIFLLEDILLRLKESCIPQMRNINPGLLLFMDEIEKIDWNTE